MAQEVKFERMNNDGSFGKKPGTMIKFAVAGVAALFIALNSFTIIPAGHSGVVMTLGKVSDNVLQEGFHLKAPFVQNVETMSNKIQVYETSSSAVSKDLQSISSVISVNYKISNEASAEIYKNVGTDYKTVLIMPIVQEGMKSATAKYTAEELITKRAAVGDEIKSILDAKLNEYGIYIEKFNIVNFDFSQEFNEAIEAKQVAEQNLIKTKTEQEQAIVIANAEAEKKIIAANAEADAIKTKAQAQADANKLLQDSLSSIVLQYEKIQKWNGTLPKVTGDSDLLIDVGLDDTASN
ncbi:MAG: prohibitin family protein [Ruminococcus sp.]|nr:prohibitin family protein [Ruminococcus sp.]MBQ7008890.1 prohibitin family protein [Ruminococcus sp.]MBR4022263.1 prohibitin family protein [Ruminococcus sp.]